MNKVSFFDIFSTLLAVVAGFVFCRIGLPYLLSYPSNWTVGAAVASLILLVAIAATCFLNLIRNLLRKDSAPKS
jgi:hypothetical protein